MNPRDVPIPHRMRRLELDHRGYPTPANVFRDESGRAHFTINNSETHLDFLRRDICPICGFRIVGPRWFIGGPKSAFHDDGMYFDLPTHAECKDYAMQVCPYLAAPNYSKRIEAATLNDPPDKVRVFVDQTMDPDRPQIFVCVLSEVTLTHKIYVYPQRPYLDVEFWQHGRRLEGEGLIERCREIAAEGIPNPQQPRVIVK